MEKINTTVEEEIKSKRKYRKKRNIDPNKTTFLTAFSLWKEKNKYSGILSPKRGTEEHKQIMNILNEHKQKEKERGEEKK